MAPLRATAAPPDVATRERGEDLRRRLESGLIDGGAPRDALYLQMDRFLTGLDGASPGPSAADAAA